MRIDLEGVGDLRLVLLGLELRNAGVKERGKATGPLVALHQTVEGLKVAVPEGEADGSGEEDRVRGQLPTKVGIVPPADIDRCQRKSPIKTNGSPFRTRALPLLT